MPLMHCEQSFKPLVAGRIAPGEGSTLASLVAAYAHSINIAAVELRIDDIEKRQKEIQSLLEELKKS